MEKTDQREVTKKRRWIFSRKKKKEKEEDAVTEEVLDLKKLLESKGIDLKPRVNTTQSSKLTPSLLDILKKSVALGHFLDFLMQQNEKHLLDFWLEAETFRMVSETKYNRKLNRTSSTSSRSSFRVARTTNNKSNNIGSVLEDSFSSEQSSTDCFSIDTPKESIDCSNSTEICNTVKGQMLNDQTCLPGKIKELDVMHPSNHNCNGETANSVTTEIKSDFQKINTQCSSTLSSVDEFKQRARTRSCIVDTVTIYAKYISLNADYSIHLPENLRQQIESIICKDKDYLDPSCFVDAQEFSFEKLSSLHEEFLLTSNMISHQLKVLEGKLFKLQDVLYNESSLFYFMEFLDQKCCKSTLEFYIAAENFEEDIKQKMLDDNYNIESAVSDAMYIYERYFSMKCEHQLIADDKLRIVLENNICREDGPQSNCFCIPMAYAWTVLSDVYLPEFILSEIYTSYLEQLRTTSSTLVTDLNSCSSRSSLSVDDNFPLIKSDSKCNLLDDKGLGEFWFKPQEQNASRLALGHVNEFGAFSSGMEPEPISGKETNYSVSKFGKAMKNLIRGETREETEQLAWERARKIIADIQKETRS